MKNRLIWKLFGLNLVIIGFVVLIVWGTIDYLAEGYFMSLMDKYHIDPREIHNMFIGSIHRYLIWSSLCSILFSSLFSYLIIKRILGPLTQMTRITDKVASGDFSAAIPVRTHDEVGQLASAFNHMTRSLGHMEQLRKTMIVDVAHEFKTPLTNINGYLEALQDKVIPPTPETLDLLQEETKRLNRLVNDILKLARAGGARLNLDILEIDLKAALSRVSGMFALQFTEKNIEADLTGIPAGCAVSADPHILSQILHNLFQNALLYTNPNGTFRVFSSRRSGHTRVTFANTGGEIKADDLPLMFERFYRGEKSRSRDYGGAGIGLAIVKDLVEAHEGQVGACIENEEVQVWFSLPDQPVGG